MALSSAELGLRRARRNATGLLLAAAALYLLSWLPALQHPITPFVRAFAEAAMVGGIADWFAVTALFRHPLGIPIPHTAIIPTRQAILAHGVGEFIVNNFLDEQRIVARLRALDPARRIAGWLRQPGRADQAADLLSDLAGGALRVVRDDQVAAYLTARVKDRLARTSAAPLVGHLLGALAPADRQRELVQSGLAFAVQLTVANETTIRARIAEELPGWLPRIVDQKIYERVRDVLQRTEREIAADPQHPLLRQVAVMLDEWIVGLQYDPDWRARGEAITHELLDHPIVHDLALTVWRDLKQTISEVSLTDAPLRETLHGAVRRLAVLIARDPAWQQRIDDWLVAGTRLLVQRYGRTIAEFISQTIAGWSPAVTSRLIEQQFGRDLQFIRINGTIVGGLVGLTIYTVTRLVTMIVS
jgi:uncharacterized membrane-anchored protein YjiN (DUF445 family)